MKVKHLIDMLKRINGELEIYLSTDSEGNSYGAIDYGCIIAKNENGKSLFAGLYPCEEEYDFFDLYRKANSNVKR